MKCQILFSGEKKKNIINLSSAELAQRVVKVNAPVIQRHFSIFLSFDYSPFHLCFYSPLEEPVKICIRRHSFIFQRKIFLTFHVNRLLQL